MDKPRDSIFIITAGSSYLDIDAYACMVAMAELLNLQGRKAVAYSNATCNYSVINSITAEGQILRELPVEASEKEVNYIIVDVSDPEFLKNTVPLDSVRAVYDHHVGFEDYWHGRIGKGAHIEFVGAAATLIYREWKKAKLHDKINCLTAKLMIAAILDNTLNLTSTNTTDEDINAFTSLCTYVGVGDEFRAAYFSDVQAIVEDDLENAIFNDMKILRDNKMLPPRVAQLSVWDTSHIFTKLPEIRTWFARNDDAWMINVIDLSKNCSFFVCDDKFYQDKLESVFSIHFKDGVARTTFPYLRKQIIKKALALM